jgi:prepilin-type N-terminal cleavage/methylation domain-containing protein
MRKSGFTIVEMLMVVAVLSVLLGIITTTASSAIRQSRVKKAAAMRSVLEAGLATYYAQQGEWPGKLKSWSEKGTDGGKLRVDYLSETEADSVFQELVSESLKGRPMLDVSGLFVARASVVGADSSRSKAHGMEFRAATAPNRKGGRLSASQLAYGYATKETGEFRRFIIKYNFETDSVTVMTQNESASSDDYAKETGKQWPQKPDL